MTFQKLKESQFTNPRNVKHENTQVHSCGLFLFWSSDQKCHSRHSNTPESFQYQVTATLHRSHSIILLASMLNCRVSQ